jgi:hypothetical protein
VVLSFALAAQVGSDRLPELGLVLGCLWEEVAFEPGITEVSLTAGLEGELIHLRATGTGELSGPEKGWSSPLPRALMGRLTHNSSLTRGEDLMVIDADFSIRP